jgi:adenylate cyclase
MVSGYRAYQKFFADLKRRQVFKVAAVYGAVAFAVMQAADFLVPALRLPEAVATALAVVAIFGFPIAVALAWVFDRTPAGIVRTEAAAPGELEEIVAQPRLRRWPAGVLALLCTLLLLGAGWWALGSGGSPDTYDSIAVLPFLNMSGDPEDEYFSDGLAEELLNALAGIEELKVAARTSAFSFKGRNADAREIGRALDVETVLEGSVRRAGDRVRIAAQLIDTSNGYHIWSREYDRRLDDIFAVQDEIAGAIADALAVSLGVEEARDLYLGGTVDVQAYELYLHGRQRWATRRVPDLHRAVADFEAAIARDSAFALAWSGLADAIDALAWREPESRALVPSGLAAARRAIALEPELAEGHASLGILLSEFERDYARAEEPLRRAVELKPGYATAHLWYGDLLIRTGRVEEALEQNREAARLDPLSGLIQLTYANNLAMAGRREEAAEQYERAAGVPQPDPDVYFARLKFGRGVGLDAEQLADAAETWARMWGIPDPAGWRVIGAGLVDSTRRPAALEALDSLSVRVERSQWYRDRALGELWLAYGENERALDHLERAFEAEDPYLWSIGLDPAWDPVRQEPRFQRTVEALGVPNGYSPER